MDQNLEIAQFYPCSKIMLLCSNRSALNRSSPKLLRTKGCMLLCIECSYLICAVWNSQLYMSFLCISRWLITISAKDGRHASSVLTLSEQVGEATLQSPCVLAYLLCFWWEGAFDQLKQNATKARIPFYGRSDCCLFCSSTKWCCVALD